MTIRKCIFTSVMGGYDKVHEPTVITSGWDYIYFTDNSSTKSKYWDVRVVKKNSNINDVKNAKKICILFHRYVNDYDISISIGGQICPNSNLNSFLEKFLPDDEKVDMAMHDRGIREGIYHEGRICIYKKKDDPLIIKRQLDFYKKEGLPKDTGILSTGIVIRKHNRLNVEKHHELWWEQVKNGSHRNQLSFNYILWKYNLVNISRYPCDPLRGEDNYFRKYKHGG